MFIVLLKFGPNKALAPKFMAPHKAWIEQGVESGIFKIVGSLDAGGGFILAHGEERSEIEMRVSADPFVQKSIVVPEIYQIDINRVSNDLAWLSK